MSAFSGGGSVATDSASFTPGSSAVFNTGFLVDEVSTGTVSEGQTGVARMTAERKVIVSSEYADGAAMTAGSSYVGAFGAVVDDAAVSQAAEGTVGYVRMSTDRVLMVTGRLRDQSSAPGTPNVVMVGGVARASAVTYAEGAAAILTFNMSGAAKVVETQMPIAENNTDGVINTYRKFPTTSTNAVSVDQSAALEASSVVKNAAGRFLALIGRIDSTHATGNYYIQVLNASSLPVDGSVTFLKTPKKIAHVNGTNSDFTIDANEIGGIYASTGIVWCISTTEFTKTISGAYVSADCYYV